jgi:hypothetical protein
LQTDLHFEAFYVSWISLEDKYYLQKAGQVPFVTMFGSPPNLVQDELGGIEREEILF